jgi:hypothetical protein
VSSQSQYLQAEIPYQSLYPNMPSNSEDFLDAQSEVDPNQGQHGLDDDEEKHEESENLNDEDDLEAEARAHFMNQGVPQVETVESDEEDDDQSYDSPVVKTNIEFDDVSPQPERRYSRRNTGLQNIIDSSRRQSRGFQRVKGVPTRYDLQ